MRKFINTKNIIIAAIVAAISAIVGTVIWVFKK